MTKDYSHDVSKVCTGLCVDTNKISLEDFANKYNLQPIYGKYTGKITHYGIAFGCWNSENFIEVPSGKMLYGIVSLGIECVSPEALEKYLFHMIREKDLILRDV